MCGIISIPHRLSFLRSAQSGHIYRLSAGVLAVIGVLSSGLSFRDVVVPSSSATVVPSSCHVLCVSSSCRRGIIVRGAIVDGVPRLAVIVPSSCRCVVMSSCHCEVVPL